MTERQIKKHPVLDRMFAWYLDNLSKTDIRFARALILLAAIALVVSILGQF